jgi:hypothetical protein
MDGEGRSFKRSGKRSAESKPNEATEPVAQHPAAFESGTAQPARSRKPLAPTFGAKGAVA